MKEEDIKIESIKFLVSNLSITMKKIFLFILPLFISCAVAQKNADQIKYAGLITEESSHAHMQELATDAMEGRGTGQAGGLKAAEYIADQFKSYGLTAPVNGSYFQSVPLVKKSFQVENFVIDGIPYANGKDFYVQADIPMTRIESNSIVFAGYGIQSENYNDLAGIDVKGKIVLLINEEEPIDAAGNSIITGTKEPSEWVQGRFKRLQELIKLEPKLILATGPQVGQLLERFSGRLTGGRITLEETEESKQEPNESVPPIVFITENVANKVLAQAKTDLNTFKQSVSQTSKPASINVNSKIDVLFGVKNEKLSDPNVLGYLEGTDKKDEVLIITAHYDHDGINDEGVIFFGADDNASGTVGVLELARAFSEAKKDGKGPRRSILFIAFAAEEKGLLGSRYYVNNPVIPLNNTIVNLNMDMIGRIDDKHLDGNHNYIHTIGANRTSKELFEINELANKTYTDMEIDYMYDVEDEPMQLFKRSDQYNFVQKNIPVIFYFSGLHPHYHTPEDTIDKIDFPMMVKREKLVFHTAWELANRDNKLQNDLIK